MTEATENAPKSVHSTLGRCSLSFRPRGVVVGDWGFMESLEVLMLSPKVAGQFLVPKGAHTSHLFCPGQSGLSRSCKARPGLPSPTESWCSRRPSAVSCVRPRPVSRPEARGAKRVAERTGRTSLLRDSLPGPLPLPFPLGRQGAEAAQRPPPCLLPQPSPHRCRRDEVCSDTL